MLIIYLWFNFIFKKGKNKYIAKEESLKSNAFYGSKSAPVPGKKIDLNIE